MHTVLIIDDEEPIRKMLGIFLRSEGYRVLEAADGLEGVDVFEEHRPPIVLTDVRMPRLGGLDLLRRIRAIDGDTAVIVITGHGGEETAIEALRGGATNYLKKPIEISELSGILSRLVGIIESRAQLAMYPGYLQCDERELILDNNLDRVGSIIAYLTSTTHNFFSRADVNYVKLGLDEMIRNAIEHGNLGITYDEKTTALDNEEWDDLLRRRIADPLYGSRRVHVVCRQTPEQFECDITDEGAGFDWRDLPDPKDPANLLSSHGRGILLTSFYYDEITYSERGNHVRLVKKVPLARDQSPQAVAVERAGYV